ncbi:MAG TPA: lipid-A-disaccharide synthase [Thermoanaerobaculia bacterium]|jgi:lipid-A-disaccharide synthase
MNLLISAGEASGDLHGARLLTALRRLRPGVSAFGMGGARLQAAGLERVVASESLGVMGIFEVFEKMPALIRALSRLTAEALRRRPDAAVLIDFPDFHGLLARRLRRKGIPLIYYVSPQVWAWRKGRARKIAARARRIVTFFEFEARLYQGLGGDAVWAGHPLVDDVAEGLRHPAPLPAKTRRRLVLLPGSRTAELSHHWAPMSAAAVRLAGRHELELFAVRPPGLPESLYPGAAENGIRLISQGMHTLLASADLALVASGTATLEAALCGTPMVVVYRSSEASFRIVKALVSVRWASLVNIVADEEVVPELLQRDFTAERLELEAERLLSSAETAARMRAALARVAAALGPPGATERAAEAVREAVERPRAAVRSTA